MPEVDVKDGVCLERARRERGGGGGGERGLWDKIKTKT